jgi:D-alanine-D-alanine ligase
VRVAVLAGGRSSEHEISRSSATSISQGLAAAGHEPVLVEISREGLWTCDDVPVTIEPGRGLLHAAVAFPALHGPFGEDGVVQGLLEVADVPYVGAGVLASAVCLDKVTFKELMGRCGIPQVEYAAVRRHEPAPDLERLGLPVFVKPSQLGSSVGISKVTSADELQPALEAAFVHDRLAIVECMSHGLEVECSVIGNDSPEASEPGEIAARSEWYDHEAKYTEGGMELVVPARVEPEVRERVRQLAVEVFLRVGCAGMARVDFFVEDGQQVLVNELNTIPGFTPTSVFPKLFEASGVSYPELLDRLLALALERYEDERSYRR